MLPAERRDGDGARQAHALVFAALGDETRLALVTKLSGGQAYSIAQLTEEQASGGSMLADHKMTGSNMTGSRITGSKITRQAITKHLRVLERARIVRCVRSGRESRFEFDPRPMEELKEYLELVSAQWDQALGRLKSFVEG